jgi:ketosteroid isomerase-like protein
VALTRDAVARWLRAYEAAWRTAGTEALRGLFSADATYRMSPYEQPATGLAAIAELWEAERNGPAEPFAMEHEILAVDGDLAVVRLEVRYERPPGEYRDLWLLRFAPDGRCAAFEEWPYWPGQDLGPGR